MSISEGETPESAVDGTIQSLIDHGEFELCFKRLDEPEPGQPRRDFAKPS